MRVAETGFTLDLKVELADELYQLLPEGYPDDLEERLTEKAIEVVRKHLEWNVWDDTSDIDKILE